MTEGEWASDRALEHLYALLVLVEKPRVDGGWSFALIASSTASIDISMHMSGDVRGVLFLMHHSALTSEMEHHMQNARDPAQDMRLCFVPAMSIPRLVHLPGGFSEYSSRVAVTQARINY